MWVPGHKDVVMNELADQLAKEAANKSSIAFPEKPDRKLMMINDDDNIESNLQTIPHVGWNKLIPQFKNYENYDCSDKYFVHSYSAKNCDQKIISHICMYGGNPIVSAVKENFLAGCQFHPEKSGVDGLIYLKNTILKLIN